MTIAAKYEDGVVKPLEDVKVKEGTVVEVHLPCEQEPAGQALLDRLEEAEAMTAAREGIEQISRGEGIPWPEAKKKLLKKHGF
jgi:predicted DNA-binding antitoxin AbrB/MazE fold protein